MRRVVKRVLIGGLLALALSVGAGAAAQGGAPADVAAAFLDAWASGAYDAMYSRISPRSQALYDINVFRAMYSDADGATGRTGLTYTIVETQLQGASAAVIYDLSLESAFFEPIVDRGRIMRLVQSPEGWRVAWSSMDIFDGMAPGAQLRATGQRSQRANIYDRNGQALAEQNATVTALYIRRATIPDEANCLDLLASLLRRQRQDLQAFFNRYPTLETVFYVGEIDTDEYAARGQQLSEVCGIQPQNTLERQTRRYYRGNAVSHVTGYIGQIPADQLEQWQDRGYQSGDLVGRNGVELAFEAELSGQARRVLSIIEPGGTVLRELSATEGQPPRPVTLTIDRDLQLIVAQALADAFNYAEPNWGNRDVSPGGAAVVLDVNTGAILAAASYPLFEPDVFNPDTYCCTIITAGDRIAEMLNDPRAPLFNRVFQGQYAPGSIFKIVTAAAAAEEGIFGLDDTFYCGLSWDGAPFGDTVGFERKDWRFTDGLEPAGEITMAQALTSSCDPFFYQMGAELFNRRGPTALIDYGQRMGLTRTGINYYGAEAPGEIPLPNSVAAAINEAIGQGDVKVSPIQMAKLIAAVANGGTVYQPYLVQRVGGADGTPVTFEAEPQVVGNLQMRPETLAMLREGMCAVTTDPELGTAVWPFERAGFTVCGKTGTAQTARYPQAWFVAYSPADNPQIALVVMVEQSLEGSQIAAPITRRILEDYYGEPRFGYPPFWAQGPYVPLQAPEGGTIGG
ncbi:MAG: peptidoglycan D,D-transpeptidase FtsI family protein [Aggregatilineales bacterium]